MGFCRVSHEILRAIRLTERELEVGVFVIKFDAMRLLFIVNDMRNDGSTSQLPLGCSQDDIVGGGVS